MFERTLVVVKPDGVRKGLIEEIKSRYEKAGLKVLRQHTALMTQLMADALYRDLRDLPRYDGCVLAMMSGEVSALLIEGENAIAVVRNINGHWDPKVARTGTIRHDFPSANGPFNIVHASDSPESAHRETQIFFGE